MMETDNSGSPVRKKEDEKIVDLINEMTRNLETEPELTLLSAEVPPSGDQEDEILELSEEVFMDDADNTLMAPSEKPAGAGYDTAAEGILELDVEAPVTEEMEGEAIELLGEVPSLEITAEEILELRDGAPLLAEAEGDVVSKPIQHAKDLVQDGFELGEALDLAIDKQLVVNHDLVAALGPDAPPEEARPGHSDSGVPSVSSEQLEAAIERVIDRMLGEKMDHLLATAVENAVTREISRLKRLLSDLT